MAGVREMTKSSPIVFVVDDDVSVRESIELLLQSEGWHAQTFASAADFLAAPRPLAPSCLVLDVSMPGLTGLELQAHLANRNVDMPIIFITGVSDVPTSVKAMKAGALEFLVKPFTDEALLGAVRQALWRNSEMLACNEELQGLREKYALLSKREREVMALVVTGMLNKRIADRLSISEITVKAHRGRVMQKMGAGSLADLVKMAGKLGPDPAPQNKTKMIDGGHRCQQPSRGNIAHVPSMDELNVSS